MNKTYLISYEAHYADGTHTCHMMRVKNSMSDLHAKSKLEEYLKRKVKGFNRLVVLTCREDNPLVSVFDEIFKTKK